jgi:ATP-binding cassette subfamily B protein
MTKIRLFYRPLKDFIFIFDKKEKLLLIAWVLLNFLLTILDLLALAITGVLVSAFIPIIQSKPGNIPSIVKQLYLRIEPFLSLYEFLFTLAFIVAILLTMRSLLSLILERYFLGKLTEVNQRILEFILTFHFKLPIDKRIKKNKIDFLQAVHSSLNSLTHYVIGNFIIVLSEIFGLIMILLVVFVWKPIITSILIFVIVSSLILAFKLHIKKSQKILRNYSKIDNHLTKEFLKLNEFANEFLVRSQLNQQIQKYLFQRNAFSEVISTRINQFGYPRLILESGVLVSGFLVSLLVWYFLNITEGLVVLSSYLILGFRVVPAILKVQNGIQVFLQHNESSRLALEVIRYYKNIEINKPNNSNIKNLKSPTLNISNLSYSFDDENLLLNKINFEIKTNGVYLIYGSNGTGKTTLLEILMGLRVPQSGSIKLNQQDIVGMNPEAIGNHIAFLTQKSVFSTQSIADSLLIGKLVEGVTTNESLAEALEMLNQFNFDFNKYDLFQEYDLEQVLSEGEKQKIALVRTLIRKSTILILDEPTVSLDLKSKEVLLNLVNKISKIKIVLIVTHESIFDDNTQGRLAL